MERVGIKCHSQKERLDRTIAIASFFTHLSLSLSLSLIKNDSFWRRRNPKILLIALFSSSSLSLFQILLVSFCFSDSLMAELTQADVVYSPRSFQVWKTLVNWLAFLYQIFLQILRAVGYHPLLSSSAKASADGFKPLPAIELLDRASESPTTVDIASTTTSDSSDCERSRFHRLKVCLELVKVLWNLFYFDFFLLVGRRYFALWNLESLWSLIREEQD